RGVYLAGGGALTKGLAERLERDTGITFYRAEDPLGCVVRGVGKVMEELPNYQRLCIA
ncbi:MAG: rod shape-determining protein, partial [Bdellovibrionales bacterium]|nr:rod shape-determining protein [Bdellovibrionales bacterium]